MCGERYRREVSDLGLGLGECEMQVRLKGWGYAVARESCRKWLLRYRLELTARHGTAALYELSNHDLQYWYHVDKLGNAELQARYLHEHGVYADRRDLERWLRAPAQALPVLRTNEDVHTHACGEYVLQQLQEGASPGDVAESLLHRYLIVATQQRVQAYRRYREQRSEYWTVEALERVHWKVLYALVRARGSFADAHRVTNTRLASVRAAFCDEVSLAEEFVPLSILRVFFFSP